MQQREERIGAHGRATSIDVADRIEQFALNPGLIIDMPIVVTERL